MSKKKIKLPPIGLRIIKSAVAVFMCYAVNLLRAGGGIVFYSQLSALWCMQDYASDTKKNAIQRTEGTFIGALYGLIVLVMFNSVSLDGYLAVCARALTVAAFIVPIIYTTVILNRRNASYFSCVVFLSIVVNHANDINPYLFVLNRVLDTMIGIAIGVGLNLFRFKRKKNQDTLFISGLDDTLFNENNNLSAYSRVELNRMIDEGLNFTISTIRTPASLIDPLRDIRLKLPVIAMDGAALFNISEKRFEKVYIIPMETAREVSKFFEKLEQPFFTNIVIDDTVLIYYNKTDSEIYNTIVEKLRKSPYRNYINRRAPENENVVYYMTVDKKERIADVLSSFKAAGFDRLLKITVSDSSEYEGYTYLRIYNRNASKKNMIDYLLQMTDVKSVSTFGTIPGQYTHLITPGDSNTVVRMIKHDFER
jgi:hydroxymethylpyrimidine pyrophosphatase-like HAD family hydrolase